MKILDIIIPVLDEENLIDLFYDEVLKVFNNNNLVLDINFIFIDDGSKDNTLEKIKTLSRLYKNIHYISFSRNFGKEAAILAGLKKSNGDYISVMDVDMQDPPYLLLDMFNLLEKDNYDAILTARKDRKGDPIVKSFFSRCFYIFCNFLSDYKIKPGSRDFCMMKKHYKDALLLLKEKKDLQNLFSLF